MSVTSQWNTRFRGGGKSVSSPPLLDPTTDPAVVERYALDRGGSGGWADEGERTAYLVHVRGFVVDHIHVLKEEQLQGYNRLFASYPTAGIPPVQRPPAPTQPATNESNWKEVQRLWRDKFLTEFPVTANQLAAIHHTRAQLQLDPNNLELRQQVAYGNWFLETHAVKDPLLAWAWERDRSGQVWTADQVRAIEQNLSATSSTSSQPITTNAIVSVTPQPEPQPIPLSTPVVDQANYERSDGGGWDVTPRASSNFDLLSEDRVGPLGGVELGGQCIHPGEARHQIFKQVRETLIQSDIYRPANRWRGSS